MGSNGVDHPLKHLEEEGGSSQGQSCFQQERNQKTNSSRPSPVLEIFQAKEFNVGSSPRRGLLIEDYEIRFPRSRMERKGRHDLKLDRLSEHEKRKLIVEMVKIQNDGTVEVDLGKSAPVASEFLELQTVEDVPINLDDTPSNTIKSIPRLKICILVVGTRGDVQPFLAMAKRFQEFGHHVRLATHVNFSSFVKSAGVDFYPLGGDPRVLAGYMARNKGLIPSGRAEILIQRKQLKAIIESLLPACTEPDIETGVPFKAQAIVANPPAYGHAHVAEALGVPLHIFFTMPWTPTYEFPHPLARVPQSAGYWISYIIVDLLIWWGIRGYINDFRKKKLKLSPIAYFSTYHGSISHLPTGYMWSPHVVPKPSDWGSLVDVVGYCFLNLGSKYQPQDEFVEWIQKGPKPIYIGFGSMPLDDPKKTTNIILEALKDTGQRGIIDRGWGDLGNVTEASNNVFLLEDSPHDWLFPQCSAVVHHGGAGTTATGLRAGCPTTIVPFFGDQFFWGDRIHEKGLGPVPIPISQLSVENLSNAIRFMLEPEGLSRMKDRLRNPNRIQPAPVVPARATSNPTFLLSLLALYMTLSIYPQNMKRVVLDGTLVEAYSAILISVGMEATFYILINWVADQPYPLLSWLALIIGKILFWISQYRNVPFMVFYPTVFVLNALVLGSLAIKVTWIVGWGVAYQFLLDNLGILNLF